LSETEEKPVWKTGWLWGLLAVLLLVGTIGAATFVYGLTGLIAGNAFAAIALVLGAFVAVLAFLFMAGVLYRVDKYRGTPQRRVELFE
jgi:cell shape-determining protein MreD